MVRLGSSAWTDSHHYSHECVSNCKYNLFVADHLPAIMSAKAVVVLYPSIAPTLSKSLPLRYLQAGAVLTVDNSHPNQKSAIVGSNSGPEDQTPKNESVKAGVLALSEDMLRS